MQDCIKPSTILYITNVSQFIYPSARKSTLFSLFFSFSSKQFNILSLKSPITDWKTSLCIILCCEYQTRRVMYMYFFTWGLDARMRGLNNPFPAPPVRTVSTGDSASDLPRSSLRRRRHLEMKMNSFTRWYTCFQSRHSYIKRNLFSSLFSLVVIGICSKSVCKKNIQRQIF